MTIPYTTIGIATAIMVALHWYATGVLPERVAIVLASLAP